MLFVINFFFIAVYSLVADKDISTVENSLQTDLQIVREWLIDNKLSLHLSKTGSILFGSKSRLRPWS